MPSEEQWTFNPFIAFTEQWLETWQRVNALGLQNLQGITLFGDPRLRSCWMAGLSHAMDNYMRSPAFLELMQQSLEVMTGIVSSPSDQQDRRTFDGDHISRLP